MKPHEGVYARLGCSAIHGVGVIAIRDIPRGAAIFGADDEKMVWVRRATVSRLSAEVRRLYEDFCVAGSDRYGCPRNFNDMTLSWYMNHSDEPNVRCDAEYRFTAIRKIARGEELTTDYRAFCEGRKVPPLRPHQHR